MIDSVIRDLCRGIIANLLPPHAVRERTDPLLRVLLGQRHHRAAPLPPALPLPLPLVRRAQRRADGGARAVGDVGGDDPPQRGERGVVERRLLGRVDSSYFLVVQRPDPHVTRHD